MTANRLHRRLNPLTGRHVLVSPQRTLRPWLGASEAPQGERGAAYDPECYLCPGNVRASGAVNLDYDGVFAFENDFPALLDEAGVASEDGPFVAEAVRGCSRVICFSPDHGATLADLDQAGLEAVVVAWCAESATLGKRWRSVQIFENKGAMMGCSNPHPHGQVWATDFVPDEVALEDERQRAWHAAHGRALLIDVAEREALAGVRVVEVNDHWLAFVPFWAMWPFEVLLVPLAPLARLPELDPVSRTALATILGRITQRYDAVFGEPFPYSLGWHGAPFDGDPASHWQLHAHFYPPLLRSASVRKFMVGFEMFGEAQRDLTPEAAARTLREALP